MAKRHSRRNYSFCGAELDTGFYKKSNKSEKLPPPMQYEPTSQLSPTIESADLNVKGEKMTDKYIPMGLEKELIDAKYLTIKNIYGDEGDLQYRDVLYCKKCNKLLASFDHRALAHLWRFHTIKPKVLRETVWQELGQVLPTLEEAS